jgi:hypothetical protein
MPNKKVKLMILVVGKKNSCVAAVGIELKTRNLSVNIQIILPIYSGVLF